MTSTVLADDNPFADFDAWADEHPELEPPEAFGQWLASLTGETVVGRQIDGDGIVVATAD